MTNKPYAPRSATKFNATHTCIGLAPTVYFSDYHKRGPNIYKPKVYGKVPVWQYTGWHHNKKNYKLLKQEAKQNG